MKCGECKKAKIFGDLVKCILRDHCMFMPEQDCYFERTIAECEQKIKERDA